MNEAVDNWSNNFYLITNLNCGKSGNKWKSCSIWPQPRCKVLQYGHLSVYRFAGS